MAIHWVDSVSPEHALGWRCYGLLLSIAVHLYCGVVRGLLGRDANRDIRVSTTTEPNPDFQDNIYTVGHVVFHVCFSVFIHTLSVFVFLSCVQSQITTPTTTTNDNVHFTQV